MKRKVYKVITIDDEEASHISLEFILAEYSDIEIIANIYTADEAIRKICELKPDIIFLDIKLPIMDGFTILDAIQKKQTIDFEVIFLTGWDNFALKAIKYNAFDYLLKPIDPDEMHKALEKFRNKQLEEKTSRNFPKKEIFNPCEKIRISSANEYRYINPDDILYIKGDGSYSDFYLINSDKKITSCSNLKHYEELLAACNFLRIHKSCIINKKYLTTYNRKTKICTLEYNKDKKDFQVSQRMEKNLG